MENEKWGKWKKKSKYVKCKQNPGYINRCFYSTSTFMLSNCLIKYIFILILLVIIN